MEFPCQRAPRPIKIEIHPTSGAPFLEIFLALQSAAAKGEKKETIFHTRSPLKKIIGRKDNLLFVVRLHLLALIDSGSIFLYSPR
jgi:hypothetical protein